MDQELYFLERRIIIFIISRKEYITGRIGSLNKVLYRDYIFLKEY
jgi:hypothetical protein